MPPRRRPPTVESVRSEEHTSELQSRGLISYAVFCLKKKKTRPTSPPHASQGAGSCAPSPAAPRSEDPVPRAGTWPIPARVSAPCQSCFFFFNDPATTEIYPLPLHGALPICPPGRLQLVGGHGFRRRRGETRGLPR